MLVAMAVWDTEENGRTGLTETTLRGLAWAMGFHRVIVVDNDSCFETKYMMRQLQEEGWRFEIITNDVNVGTAAAINQAWTLREPGQHCVKMDNDVTIMRPNWADLLEEALNRDATLGILGLKRKDLAECPWGAGTMKSMLRMLPHEAGQRWQVVEEVEHVMGTCQAYSSALLDKIGYLYQMQDEGNLYGFDDSLASHRARLAGFKRAFLHGIEIDHIDPGGDEATQAKQKSAGKWFARYDQVVLEYEMGTRSLYYADL